MVPFISFNAAEFLDFLEEIDQQKARQAFLKMIEKQIILLYKNTLHLP